MRVNILGKSFDVDKYCNVEKKWQIMDGDMETEGYKCYTQKDQSKEYFILKLLKIEIKQLTPKQCQALTD